MNYLATDTCNTFGLSTSTPHFDLFSLTLFHSSLYSAEPTIRSRHRRSSQVALTLTASA